MSETIRTQTQNESLARLKAALEQYDRIVNRPSPIERSAPWLEEELDRTAEADEELSLAAFGVLASFVVETGLPQCDGCGHFVKSVHAAAPMGLEGDFCERCASGLKADQVRRIA